MRNTVFLIALFLSAAANAQSAPRAAAGSSALTGVLLDRIAVIVNDEVITVHELNNRTEMVLRQLKREGTPQPSRPELEKQLLERMITDRVQMQFARETGLRVDDLQVDRALGRIAETNGMTLQAFRDALERDGVPFGTFREDIRTEIVMQRLREREVENKLIVSESEIDGYLQDASKTQVQSEYNLAHILVRVPEQASAEQIEARRIRAEQARTQIASGVDFRQVAAAFSDAPDALQGGILGWRAEDRLPTLFVEALSKIKVGETSAVMRSSNGFHLVKLLERRGSSASPKVQQTRVRHILVKINELVSETEARRKLTDLKLRLDNKAADFAELARLHSTDTSAAQGGDLGWVYPGDTVPEFERVMDALKPGEVSGLVQTPFGMHLIQVVERRQEDVYRERQRQQARQALRARKSDEAYQEWLRLQRDQAYVEYRQEDR
jgi:peptidyl-prolyl cis-trans isomerase SurA